MAAPQVRNMATIGGNIASAIPSADLPPILIAMNAGVVLQAGDRQRTVALDSFFQGPRQSARKHAEVLTAIVVPRPPSGFGAAYVRFALREANACAVAGVAASVRLSGDETIADARVVLCAVAPTPKLVKLVADVLVGETPGEAAFDRAARAAMEAAEPISDIRGSDAYRRELVGVLTRRALTRSLERARENTR
jgi:carbon-monoxide dehydrogenase medium subunit